MEVCEIFNSKDFSLRTLKAANGKIYFNGHDVALGLGYQNTARAISTHVPDKYKIYSTIPNRYGAPNQGGAPRVYISRPGLSLFLQRSKMPAAEKYCEWVNEEVLESIFDKGFYKWELHAQYKAIADQIDRETPNFEEIKQANDELAERLKDQKKVELGRRGGQACQQKHRKRAKELKQTKIDLTMFRVRDELLEKCKDEIEKQEAGFYPL